MGYRMMARLCCLPLAVALLISQADVLAQEATAPGSKGRYQGLTTWQEQALSSARTDQEKSNVLRDTVRRGRYSGVPRLQRMFNNFDKPFDFDNQLPGISTAIRLLASDNKNGLIRVCSA